MWMAYIVVFLKDIPQNLQVVKSANGSVLLIGSRLGISETSSSELVSTSNLLSILYALPLRLFLVLEDVREGLLEWDLGLLPLSLSLELP